MIKRSADDRASFRAVLTRTLVLPIALLSLLSVVFVAEIVRLERLERLGNHADQVISRVNETQKLFVDSETGLRGFLLTGRREFLEPFTQSQATLPPVLAGLREVISDDRPQLARLDQIEERWTQWTRTARARSPRPSTGSASRPRSPSRARR